MRKGERGWGWGDKRVPLCFQLLLFPVIRQGAVGIQNNACFPHSGKKTLHRVALGFGLAEDTLWVRLPVLPNLERAHANKAEIMTTTVVGMMVLTIPASRSLVRIKRV